MMAPEETPWMVTDRPVKKLWKLVRTGYALERGAVKAAIGETTARKYMNSENLPIEMRGPHTRGGPEKVPFPPSGRMCGGMCR